MVYDLLKQFYMTVTFALNSVEFIDKHVIQSAPISGSKQ